MYLAFDVGTTSVKVALFDRAGHLMRKAIVNYQLETPGVNRYEADPELYWDAVADGTREVMRASGVDPARVKTVSGCSQGETVVLLGKDDRPVRNTIVWLDQRARDEVAELSRLVPNDELYRVTGDRRYFDFAADVPHGNDRGEIKPELLTSEARLLEVIRLHPALQWKAIHARKRAGLATPSETTPDAHADGDPDPWL